MIGVVKGQRHLRHAQGPALLGAIEDHVLHLGAAERLGALLAQHPAHGVGDVALAAAVGPDDGRDAAAELQLCLFSKGFESLHFQLCQSHAFVYRSMAIWAAAWPAACLEGPEPTPHSASSTSTRMVNSFL